MARIFLSHSSADEREAVALKQWLAANGWDDVFLDVDPQRGLVAGERWQEALRRAADRCEAVVFIVSPAWARSKWCLAEFLLAKSLNKRIFGVVLKEVPLAKLPIEMTAEWQLCRLVGLGSTEDIRFTWRETKHCIKLQAQGLARLREGLLRAGLNANHFPWPPQDEPQRAPYRGLEPLEAVDAAVFFGRDAEILRGLDALRGMRASLDQRLFVILGASGAGKSSFLRAGLLPRLARDDRHFLPLPPVRPESDAVDGERGLAQALHHAWHKLQLPGLPLGQIRLRLREGPAALAVLLHQLQEAARARLLALPADAMPPTLVLPVDQAEELFTADAGEPARRFLQFLGGVLRPQGNTPAAVPLVVAFTIRSDRYEPLQTAPELAGLHSVVFDELKPMPPTRFREVIVGPARRATEAGRTLALQPDLVNALVDECSVGGDTLPLLSLTLLRLYRDYGSDGELRLDEYQAMGGLANVIRTEVESVLATEPATREAQLELLHAAFIPWLATINAQNDQPMRRVARLSDLPPDSHPLIEALARKRLLLADRRGGETVVEVAHEALLRQWNVLAQWLQDERADLKDADVLEHAAQEWQEKGRLDAWLLQAERLVIAEALAAMSTFAARLASCREFLQASRQREELRRQQEEQDRQAKLLAAQQLAAEQERRADAEEKAKQEAVQRANAEAQAKQEAIASAARVKRRSHMLVVALVMMGVALAAAGWAYVRSNQQFRQATVLRLTAQAQAMFAGKYPGNDERALMQVLAAERVAPGVAEAELLNSLLVTSNLFKVASNRSPISALAISPDGSRIVSGSYDGTLRLWDAHSGAPIGAPLQGHKDWVSSVAISPDGSRIVSGSHDKTLRLWDARSGAPIGAPLQGHEGVVASVAFSPDGSRIVSGSHDKTLRLWDARSGAPIGALFQVHETVSSVAFSPDGSRIVSGSYVSTLRLRDAYSGDVIGGATLPALRLWDARSGVLIGAPLQGHENVVTSVAFSPDGSRIVSGSHDKTLRLWDARSGAPVGTPLQGHEGGVTSVAFSPDGSRIVSGSKDKTLRLWDARSGAPIGAPLQGHELGVDSVAFSPDGSRIVSGSYDGTLRLWDARSGVSIGAPLQEHEDAVRSVAFSPDGSRIVSGSAHIISASADKTLRLWDARSGAPIGAPLQGHEKSVASVAFSPDGSRIVSGSHDKTLRLWDARSGAPIGAPLQGHESAVLSVAFSPDGSRIVSAGSMDQTLRLWDARSGAPIGAPLQGHKNWVVSVAFSPDGSRIVSGSWDNTLRLWDARSGAPIGAPLQGHESGVTSVAFSPDGSRIVSGSMDETLRLWDAGSGTPIGAPLQGHKHWVVSVAFSPDGNRIISSSEDKTLWLWPAPKLWPGELCAKLTRNMSRREWREWVAPNISYQCQCPGLPITPDNPGSKAASERCPGEVTAPLFPLPVPQRHADLTPHGRSEVVPIKR
jgi:WD40 repeat protein